MSDPQTTDERLKYWLNSNQVYRERMCLALLSLMPRYSAIRPRRPQGGPDGGRDIEAIFDNQFEIWGAIGFQNSVSDSPSDKKQARNKFSADLQSALAKKPDLKGFIFFTNVDFTPSEKDELISKAKKKGIVHVDIFDREILQHILDIGLTHHHKIAD